MVVTCSDYYVILCPLVGDMIYMYSTLLSPLLPVISPANVSERKCQEYHSHDGKMFFFFFLDEQG